MRPVGRLSEQANVRLRSEAAIGDDVPAYPLCANSRHLRRSGRKSRSELNRPLNASGCAGVDRYEDTRRILERLPTDQYLHYSWVLRAASYAGLGQIAKAKVATSDALKRHPELTVDLSSLFKPSRASAMMKAKGAAELPRRGGGMNLPVPRTVAVNGVMVDVAGGFVRDRDGREIPLRPQAFDLLKYLLENAGRLVSKDELMKAVWPDVFVTDDSLVQCVRDVRRAIGDENQSVLRAVPKRGYRFTIPAADPAVRKDQVEDGGRRGERAGVDCGRPGLALRTPSRRVAFLRRPARRRRRALHQCRRRRGCAETGSGNEGRDAAVC